MRDILHFIKENRLLLDGATGTQLQLMGMEGCPELWAHQHPNELAALHKSYVTAGSQAVFTCTFGATSLKLSEYGFEGDVATLNKELAQIARHAVGEDVFIGGSIGAIGQLIAPVGSLDFEAAVGIFKEQAIGLAQGGCDFIIIETMIDIQEARAALIAVKEATSLPVFVSLTYGEDGRTVTGTDPVSALITLQAMGASAVGCNCSTGPNEMLPLIEAMRPYATVPLYAKPNAGMPILKNGETHFDFSPEQFTESIKKLIDAGVAIAGGCCGTTPEHIRAASSSIKGKLITKPLPSVPRTLSSARSFVSLENGFITIGERINPTGKKDLQAALKNSDMSAVTELARAQRKAGAQILDVNVGMSGIDEPWLLAKVVSELSVKVDLPLCIDTANIIALEGALRIYPGRALVNSVPAEDGRLELVLDLCKKYGAMFIALPIDKGIPETVEKRTALIEKILLAATLKGMGPEFALCDPLVMPVSADGGAALVTLGVVEWCTKQGLLTTMGLSNVSFGLPQREWVNASFLALAMAKGLSAAILNPSLESLSNIRLASMLLLGQDPSATAYISRWTQEEDVPVGSPVYSAVIGGDHAGIASLVQTALLDQRAQEILNTQILSALEEVGKRFDKRITFLPQLLQSAQAVQNAMSILEPLLLVDGVAKKSTKIVLATVEGDVHDIGKNIVALMLRNHGYDVIDLGKDVPASVIVDTAISERAAAIGLSALITTTMIQMEKVIKLLHSRSCTIPVMVGGAVITPDYAKSIGANGYAADAMEAVHVAGKLTGHRGV